MKNKRSMKSYIIRRVILVIGVLCIAGGMLWSQGGISERDLARAAADPAMTLTFPVRPLTIETAAGKKIDLTVEVAATPGHWQQGLMHRTELANNAGMIFLMGQPPRVVSFWMKNTLIPLDLIFIAGDGRIAHIHKNAQPEDLQRISSVEAITSVLEIAGGQADALGVMIGDKVQFEGL